MITVASDIKVQETWPHSEGDPAEPTLSMAREGSHLQAFSLDFLCLYVVLRTVLGWHILGKNFTTDPQPAPGISDFKG